MLYRKRLIAAIFFLSAVMFCNGLQAQKNGTEFYQLKLYHTRSTEQIAKVDQYLKDAYLPALHNQGVKSVGVFKPAGIDTLSDKVIYVFTAFPSLEQWHKTEKDLAENKSFLSSAAAFNAAKADQAPFERVESILMEAFKYQPEMVNPQLKNPDRVFEFRSYESPTIDLHSKKIKMFNEGGEIEIFKNLDFKVLFYAKVISGPRMPNFIYMPVFKNIDEYKPHWKSFGDDPKWKEVSALPEYENPVSVSKIESIILIPTSYSDL